MSPENETLKAPTERETRAIVSLTRKVLALKAKTERFRRALYEMDRRALAQQLDIAKDMNEIQRDRNALTEAARKEVPL